MYSKRKVNEIILRTTDTSDLSGNMAAEQEDQGTSKRSFFLWTDEETSLLLKIMMDYKASKLDIGEDWETVRSKYDDILKIFIAAYPAEQCKEFPNSARKDQFSQEKIKTKINKLKNGF